MADEREPTCPYCGSSSPHRWVRCRDKSLCRADPPQPEASAPIGYVEESELPIRGRATLHETPDASRVAVYVEPRQGTSVEISANAPPEVREAAGKGAKEVSRKT